MKVGEFHQCGGAFSSRSWRVQSCRLLRLAHTKGLNGDGTITNNNTKLMWAKESDDGTIDDKDNSYTWANAFAVHIATLNSTNFAGHNDWRLPNISTHSSLTPLPRRPMLSLPSRSKEDGQDMGTGVALSQVQQLIRENAALRQERDGLIQLLAALGHADAEGAFASSQHPADVFLSRWPAIPLTSASPSSSESQRRIALT